MKNMAKDKAFLINLNLKLQKKFAFCVEARYTSERDVRLSLQNPVRLFVVVVAAAV